MYLYTLRPTRKRCEYIKIYIHLLQKKGSSAEKCTRLLYIHVHTFLSIYTCLHIQERSLSVVGPCCRALFQNVNQRSPQKTWLVCRKYGSFAENWALLRGKVLLCQKTGPFMRKIGLFQDKKCRAVVSSRKSSHSSFFVGCIFGQTKTWVRV